MNNIHLSPEAVAEVQRQAEEEKAFLAQIGAKVGQHEFTIGELRELFGAVANAQNWKLAVSATIEVKSFRELLGTQQAIEFMTGSPATGHIKRVLAEGALEVQFYADGYYKAVGA